MHFCFIFLIFFRIENNEKKIYKLKMQNTKLNVEREGEEKRKGRNKKKE
jgi:hypothetical protein